MLHNRRCLWRWLEDQCVTGEECWDEGVHEDKVGVVPREDDEHDSHRPTLDVASEAHLGFAGCVGEGFRSDLEHVACSKEGCRDLFGWVGDWAAHLFGDFFGEDVDAGFEDVDCFGDDWYTR